jgi:hypothetical protein
MYLVKRGLKRSVRKVGQSEGNEKAFQAENVHEWLCEFWSDCKTYQV